MRTLTFRRFPLPIALAAAVLTALVLWLAWPQSAAAHDTLVASDPAADSTVETLPDELTLTFSAALITGEGSTAVLVTDAEGNSITEGEPTIDGALVTQPLVDDAAAGEYTVLWQVISSDGHPTDGEFSFTLASSGEPAEATEPDASASPDPEETTSEAPAVPEDTTEPTEPGPDAFAGALPWIIGGVIVLAVGGVLLAVLMRRKPGANDGDDDSDNTDSATPSER